MNWNSFFHSLGDFFATVAEKAKPLVAQIKPLVEAAEEEIATIALNAVMSEAPKVIAGSEKLSNATSIVINSLGANGKRISANVAQAAVQSSYNFLSAMLHPPAK